VELARLIIAPERRGRGVGRAMVELLTERARQFYSAVIVRVHEDNQAALHCYATAGFDRVDAAEQEEWNRGQPAAYVWMSHREQSTS
jgi:ribosomal protein S18 acetylase RimI-like enzyme